jgi:hypothetical protein
VREDGEGNQQQPKYKYVDMYDLLEYLNIIIFNISLTINSYESHLYIKN